MRQGFRPRQAAGERHPIAGRRPGRLALAWSGLAGIVVMLTSVIPLHQNAAGLEHHTHLIGLAANRAIAPMPDQDIPRPPLPEPQPVAAPPAAASEPAVQPPKIEQPPELPQPPAVVQPPEPAVQPPALTPEPVAEPGAAALLPEPGPAAAQPPLTSSTCPDNPAPGELFPPSVTSVCPDFQSPGWPFSVSPQPRPPRQLSGVQVPFVAGYPPYLAEQILNQAGLRVVTVPGHASGAQTGAVVGTDPPFGSTVEFGRAVSLVVAAPG